MKKLEKSPSKKVTTKRVIVKKTRNQGTMTESAFWGMIRSCLRMKSRWWKPMQECKKKARRVYKGDNKRQKWEYKCNNCKQWFNEKQIDIDHIVEAGSLRCGEDLQGFVERLFCEEDNLQVLCKEKCHYNKTHNKK